MQISVVLCQRVGEGGGGGCHTHLISPRGHSLFLILHLPVTPILFIMIISEVLSHWILILNMLTSFESLIFLYWSHINIIYFFPKFLNKGHSLNKGQRLSYQSVRYLKSWLYSATLNSRFCGHLGVWFLLVQMCMYKIQRIKNFRGKKIAIKILKMVGK